MRGRITEEKKEESKGNGKGKGKGKGKSIQSNPEFKKAREKFEEMMYDRKLKELEERRKQEHKHIHRDTEHSACMFGTP